ncbi:MAG TPA: hypothetical protein VE177_04725, partial [Candidatus Binatus sp.]|nr:hypothetical protein [Candidatus Binatus sp.]
RLFRSCGKSARVIKEEWLKLHYPPYWHYDVLQGALVLSRAGKMKDSRMDDAVDLIQSRRRQDGKWQAGAYYWRRPDTSARDGAKSKDPWAEPPSTDVVDWGRGGPNEMLTLNSLRVLKAAGRFEVS